MRKIYIEISDICSLNCSFCPSAKGVRGQMDLRIFEKICKEISQLKKLQKALVCLHILGDPMHRRDIMDFINCAHKYQRKIDLVTSGFYTLRDELLMHPSIHQIAFSLDAGLDKNNPQPKNYLENILHFCKKHIDIKAKCFINLRLQDGFLFKNQDKIKMIINFFDKNFNQEDLQSTLVAGSRIKLAEYIFLNITKSFEWAGYKKEKSIKKYCHGGSQQIGILSDGRVVPCCMDSAGSITLGDINQTSLAEILKSKTLQEMIEGFKNGVATQALCHNCGFLA